MKTNIYFYHILLNYFCNKTFVTKVVENIKTHIFCSMTLFRKSCRLLDNVEKYRGAGQATDENMAHAHCMLDT